MNNNEGTTWWALGLDNAKFESDVAKSNSLFRSIGNTAEKEGSRIDNIFRKITVAATGFFTAQQALGYAQKIAQVRGEYQQLEVAFNTMLGSKAKADALMTQLVNTAAKTPFDLVGVSSSAKQLLAYGIAADKVNDTLVRLGNIAAGLSIPLQDIAWLYGTTMTQGRLYAEDLNQFTGRGIPMIRELAKELGVAENEVKALVSEGKVGFPEVQKVIENLTNSGGMFYNLMDKYLFTASVRADGSSKFGKNNKWGYFPAFSAAWRLGEEEFIKDLGIFSDLKFRIGYGLAGNNRIGSYQSLALMNSVTAANGNGAQAGYASRQVPNPDLKWEANKTFNVGIDFGFLNQRITFSPEFYINRSSNLLLNAKLPNSSGYTSMVINAGETQNSGVDLTINTANIVSKDFTWNTSVTFSHNKNKVKKLTGEDVQLYLANFGYSGAGASHQIGVNQPLGQFYGYVTDGLYQVEDFNYDATTKTYTLKDGVPYHGDKKNIQPGYWKFKNVDGSEDNQITESDKTIIGNALPDFYGGINNTFSWKDFDLSIFFTYSYGAEVLNATKLTNTKTALTNKNVLSVADDAHRWVTINANGELITNPEELAAVNQGKTVAHFGDNGSNNTYIHSWAIEDASYLKLSNITLGYTFPKKVINKIGLTKLRLYATGNNLFTWTPYTGFDPEVSTMSSALTPGVDFGAYPRSRSFVFGVNVAF